VGRAGVNNGGRSDGVPQAGAVTRLVDLGVPEFLVRDVLRGVFGQDLRLTPCSACGGAGCDTCGGTGVGQRRLAVEMWEG
jgi:general secretion pathway protein E